jgi:hypothetical protein
MRLSPAEKVKEEVGAMIGLLLLLLLQARVNKT